MINHRKVSDLAFVHFIFIISRYGSNLLIILHLVPLIPAAIMAQRYYIIIMGLCSIRLLMDEDYVNARYLWSLFAMSMLAFAMNKKKNTLWEKHMSVLCSVVNFIAITKSCELFSGAAG